MLSGLDPADTLALDPSSPTDDPTLSRPRLLMDSYARLTRWVETSLEVYRYELSKVLYPLFVYVYLWLIREKEGFAARTFWEEHHPRFAELAGNPCHNRIQEMESLAEITKPSHLSSNRLAQELLSAKHELRVCAYVADLLLHHLRDPSHLLLLALLNEHLTLITSLRPPAQLADEDAPGARLTGSNTMEVVRESLATNTQEVPLGRVREGLEDKLRQVVAERQAASKAAQTTSSKKTSKKTEGVDQDPPPGADPSDPSSSSSHSSSVTVYFDAASATQPGPELHSVVLNAMRADRSAWAQAALHSAQQRTDLKADVPGPTGDDHHLPSCFFMTFVNTAHGLNTAAIDKGAREMAGGFEDGSVRLYSMLDEPEGMTKEAKDARVPEDDGTAVLRGHQGPVYGVDYSHDGSLVASAGGDGAVWVWSSELRSGVVVHVQHTLPVWDVSFSPYGYYFATGSADRACCLWTTDRRFPVRMLLGHHSDVDCVTWHPNMSLVATGSSDKSVRLWDVERAGCVRILSGLRASVTSLAVSPDGMTMAAGAADGRILVWDIRMATTLATLESHTGPVWSLAYSEGSGALLCSGSADATVKVWKNPGLGVGLEGPDEVGGGGGMGGERSGWGMGEKGGCLTSGGRGRRRVRTSTT